MRTTRACFLICTVILAPVPSEAAQRAPRSLYTTVDLKTCSLLPAHREGNAWTCKGLPGYPVYVAKDGPRYFLSAGAAPEKRRAATQTLAHPNTPFDKKSNRITIEWRFYESIERRPVPYATIVRFFTSEAGRRGQVLVVTRISEDDACHMAYIDAVANSDAIMIARTIADAQYRSFDCKNDPQRAGLAGKSPM